MKELEFADIQAMHERAREYNSDRRQEAQDELYFYWISHYTDEWRQALPLRFQGQFDQVRKGGRKIISDLTANPIQADFQPIEGTDESLGDFMDRLYRTGARRNDSKEAFHNAINECVPCGFGAWRLVTDYETDRVGDTKQVIRRVPIYEANATVFFDPAAKRIDKSDAKWVQILSAYTEEDYESLKDDGDDGDEYDCDDSGFSPITSNAGIWQANDNCRHVIEHYQRYKKKVKISYYKDMFGEVVAYYKDQVDELGASIKEAGFVKIADKTIDRWCVKKYIASGEGIISQQEIAGTELPIVPYYGERAFVNGVEHYEGVTRLAQDPQRLRDFQLSYLTDIVSTSPRPKPIFYPEQIVGFEDMYEQNGADNNYAYYLQNRVSADGLPLPLGPVAVMPEQPIPSALIASIQLMSEAINDVTQSGSPNSIADVNLSGNAIGQIRAMLDEQSMVYQDHYKYAIRRDAEIFTGMTPDVYDVPRKVTLTSKDGVREDAVVMQSIIDIETGEHKIMNDLRSAKFDVFAEVGIAYESQRQQKRQELKEILQTTPPDHPLYSALMYEYLMLGDSVDGDGLKNYARHQLVLSGVREPSSDEERAWLEEASQQQSAPDANVMLAQAEISKAQADNDKNQIDWFRAQTERFNVEIKAHEAGANIDFKNIQAAGQQIDNIKKINESISFGY